jgi:hypothetical protein
MSIHAQVSPEALERLRAQRRNTTLSAIAISLLTLVFIGVLLALWLLPIFNAPDDKLTLVPAYKQPLDPPLTPPTTPLTRSKPSAPSPEATRLLTTRERAAVNIPQPDIAVSIPSLDFGSADDFGEGIGTGLGNGPGEGDQFKGIDRQLGARCSREDRLARLAKNGGTEECEEAVLKGLRWLKQTQRPDGGWTSTNTEAMTGLALLAYLGHCETPLSEEFGDSVLRAITFLVDSSMKNNGYLTRNLGATSGCYEHAIATYALAEAYTFCSKIGMEEIPNLRESVEQAVTIILNGQHPSGGWDYKYDRVSPRGGDVSITGWQIQALKAAKHTGIKFAEMDQVSRKALDYLASCQAADGGFGYTARKEPNGSRFALTGVGVLAFQMWDKPNAREVRRGIEAIAKDPGISWGNGEAGHGDLYSAYYESQAMMNQGGREWLAYNKSFRDPLLKHQLPNGTWPATAEASHGLGGAGGWKEHYRTCLCILMLEVYYRFLPGTGGE